MLFEISQTASIVEDHVCVEHKQLRLHSRRTFRHLILPDRHSPFTGTAIPLGFMMLTGAAELVNEGSSEHPRKQL
jgi:hypothetical protein